MAYVNFAHYEIGSGASIAPDVRVPSTAAAANLSELERSVVHLSKADALWSLAGRGTWRARLAHWLGINEANPLADPRLEALRRFAVILRARPAVGDADVERFYSAGFTARHWAQIERMVAPWRTRAGHGWDYGVWTILLLAAGLTYRSTITVVDDPVIAFLLGGLTLLVLAPVLLAKRSRP